LKYQINAVPLHDCVPLVVDSSQKNTVLYLYLKPEMWQKVAKFKGAEYFRKALYISLVIPKANSSFSHLSFQFSAANDWKELKKITKAGDSYLPH
jgi:hypothetical protein